MKLTINWPLKPVNHSTDGLLHLGHPCFLLLWSLTSSPKLSRNPRNSLHEVLGEHFIEASSQPLRPSNHPPVSWPHRWFVKSPWSSRSCPPAGYFESQWWSLAWWTSDCPAIWSNEDDIERLEGMIVTKCFQHFSKITFLRWIKKGYITSLRIIIINKN